MHKNKRTAQSLLEYAVIISIVMAAFVGMQLYAKRGVQGKIKDMTDNFIGTDHYASGLTKSQYVTNAVSLMHKTGNNEFTTYETPEGTDYSDRAGKEYSVNDEEWLDKLPAD